MHRFFTSGNWSRKAQSSLLVVLSLVSISDAHALNKQLTQLVKWETESNAVAKRSPEKILIENYEIPLSELQTDLAKDLDYRIKSALIFKKDDGKDYVRWIINPEDTKWFKQVESWLKAKNLSTERHHYFDAYMTASRSFVLEDPKTGYAFSGKVSTNVTGGNWKDKHFPIDDAVQIRMATDHVNEVSGKIAFDRLKLLPEPAMFGIADIDQAFGIRALGDAAEGKRYYIPAFSIMHDETSRMLAAKAGAADVAAYWRENYNKPLAEALAEFTAHFGLTYDSGHGQNFLLELDENMKPTGKVVLRDFADSYAQKEYLQALNWDEFLSKWDADNIVDGHLQMSVGILHGNTPPSWMSEQEYARYSVEFFDAYDKKFSSLTGVPVSELKKTPVTGNPGHFSYMTKTYNTKGPAWNEWRRLAHCLAGSWTARDGSPCPPNLVKQLEGTPPAAFLKAVESGAVSCSHDVQTILKGH
ncbi:MAG: hypothetical protein ABIR96_12500 [Bdellovibrionota bacterium]